MLLLLIGTIAPLVAEQCGMMGCWRCDSRRVCTQCAQASALSGGECVFCSVDGQCPSGECASGFLRVNGQCHACADNCAQCASTGPGQCDPGMCRPGFTVNPQGTCEYCAKHVKNCDECVHLGTCRTCKRGYTLQSSGTSCAACGRACNTCASPGGCDVGGCWPRWGLDVATRACAPCDKAAHCLSCDRRGPGTCDAPELCGGGRERWMAEEAWVLDDAGACAKCAPHCRSCNASGPAKCDAGFCTSTSAYVAYGLSPEGTCAPCPADCAACTYAEQCTRCRPPHQLVDGACIRCSDYCLACRVPGECDVDRCHDGFGLSSAGTATVVSADAPEPPAQVPPRRCLRCTPGCRKCTWADRCEPGHCETGLAVSSNGTCAACGEHCEACAATGPGKCDEGRCRPGFHRSADGVCEVRILPANVSRGEPREPADQGILVVPIVVVTFGEEHCVRLLHIATGSLVEDAAPFCMTWDHTIGLQCSFDSYRGMLYLQEHHAVRQIDLDTKTQVEGLA